LLFQTALKSKGRLKIELENNPDSKVFILDGMISSRPSEKSK
jgi:hypothetical protein